ncbi:hypothetical protein BDF14DRAFT_1789654 [Spinellus fusiger]|nr:hypothetical protein BDF14DRAFT_1789654 [Spinellus fusiger]
MSFSWTHSFNDPPQANPGDFNATSYLHTNETPNNNNNNKTQQQDTHNDSTDPYIQTAAMTTNMPLPHETAIPSRKRNNSLIPLDLMKDVGAGGRERAALATVFGVREYTESKMLWERQTSQDNLSLQRNDENAMGTDTFRKTNTRRISMLDFPMIPAVPEETEETDEIETTGTGTGTGTGIAAAAADTKQTVQTIPLVSTTQRAQRTQSRTTELSTHSPPPMRLTASVSSPSSILQTSFSLPDIPLVSHFNDLLIEDDNGVEFMFPANPSSVLLHTLPPVQRTQSLSSVSTNYTFHSTDFNGTVLSTNALNLQMGESEEKKSSEDIAPPLLFIDYPPAIFDLLKADDDDRIIVWGPDPAYLTAVMESSQQRPVPSSSSTTSTFSTLKASDHNSTGRPPLKGFSTNTTASTSSTNSTVSSRASSRPRPATPSRWSSQLRFDASKLGKSMRRSNSIMLMPFRSNSPTTENDAEDTQLGDLKNTNLLRRAFGRKSSKKEKENEGSLFQKSFMETIPQVIEAASVEKLVEKLTSTLDYTYMTDFFLTYRTFIHPTQLCKLLILRFRWALQDDDEDRRVVRIRTFVVMRHWLSNYFVHDFISCRDLRIVLTSFLNSLPFHPLVQQSPRDRRIVKGLKRVVRRLKKVYYGGSGSERVKIIAPPPPTSGQERVEEMVRAKLSQSAIRRKTMLASGVDVGGHHNGNMAVQDARFAPVVVIGSVNTKSSSPMEGAWDATRLMPKQPLMSMDNKSTDNRSLSVRTTQEDALSTRDTSTVKMAYSISSKLPRRGGGEEESLSGSPMPSPSFPPLPPPPPGSSASVASVDSLESALTPGTSDPGSASDEDDYEYDDHSRGTGMTEGLEMTDAVYDFRSNIFTSRLEQERRRREEEEERKRAEFFSGADKQSESEEQVSSYFSPNASLYSPMSPKATSTGVSIPGLQASESAVSSDQRCLSSSSEIMTPSVSADRKIRLQPGVYSHEFVVSDTERKEWKEMHVDDVSTKRERRASLPTDANREVKTDAKMDTKADAKARGGDPTPTTTTSTSTIRRVPSNRWCQKSSTDEELFPLPVPKLSPSLDKRGNDNIPEELLRELEIGDSYKKTGVPNGLSRSLSKKSIERRKSEKNMRSNTNANANTTPVSPTPVVPVASGEDKSVKQPEPSPQIEVEPSLSLGRLTARKKKQSLLKASAPPPDSFKAVAYEQTSPNGLPGSDSTMASIAALAPAPDSSKQSLSKKIVKVFRSNSVSKEVAATTATMMSTDTAAPPLPQTLASSIEVPSSPPPTSRFRTKDKRSYSTPQPVPSSLRREEEHKRNPMPDIVSEPLIYSKEKPFSSGLVVSRIAEQLRKGNDDLEPCNCPSCTNTTHDPVTECRRLSVLLLATTGRRHSLELRTKRGASIDRGTRENGLVHLTAAETEEKRKTFMKSLKDSTTRHTSGPVYLGHLAPYAMHSELDMTSPIKKVDTKDTQGSRGEASVNETTDKDSATPTTASLPTDRASTDRARYSMVSNTTSPISPTRGDATSLLGETYEEKVAAAKRLSIGSAHLRAPPQSSHYRRSFILSFRSGKMAQQLCYIERDILLNIDWEEMVHCKWTKMGANGIGQSAGQEEEPGYEKSEGSIYSNEINYTRRTRQMQLARKNTHGGVEQLIERFNNVCQWVACEIVRTRPLEERVKVVEKFIRLAQKCKIYTNFATLVQILLGLQSPSVSRLAKTWARVGVAEMRLLDQLSAFTSPMRNWKHIRDSMTTVADEYGMSPTEVQIEMPGTNHQTSKKTKIKMPFGGCIPFLGIYLSDLVFNSEQPAYLVPNHENHKIYHEQTQNSAHVISPVLRQPLVNFRKHRITATVVKRVLTFQNLARRYAFDAEEDIYYMCSQLEVLKPEIIRKLSFEIEQS